MSVSRHDVVFNETYYGYSAYDHADGLELVEYLAMVLGSKPALWFALMTSGEFGFERDVVEKATIDRIVLPPFDGFPPAERRKAKDLFASLDKNAEDGWNDVDMWIVNFMA